MKKLVAFGFSAAATQSWKGWDINFPGTSGQLMDTFRRYQELLRRPTRHNPAIQLPEFDREALDQLGAADAVAARDLRLTPRPVSAVLGELLEAAISGSEIEEVADYDDIVEWMAQSVEDSIMQFVGADGWALIIGDDPLRHEVFELLLAELIQIATGRRVADIRALLDLWLAGRPVLGFDESNRLMIGHVPSDGVS